MVNTFAPTVYSSDTAAMDATLGITGYAIEDFGDTTLIDGLSYSLSDPDAGPFTSLPNVYNASGQQGFQNDHWDNTFVLNNSSNNTFGGVRSYALTFHIAGGTTSLGVGLGSFQSTTPPSEQYPITNHELFINGVSYGELESLPGWDPGLGKNAYLRIDATGGDIINSVTFRNISNSVSGLDLLYFDHVAVSAIPEPTIAAPLAIFSACFAAAGRRSGCA